MSEHISEIYSDRGMPPVIWIGSGYVGMIPTSGIQFGLTSTSPRIKNPTPVAMAANEIDGDLGSNFTKTISSNTTFTIKSNSFRTGEWAIITVLNTSATATLTWPASVAWPSAAAPVQTVSSKYDRYIIECTGTNLFRGAYIQNYSA